MSFLALSPALAAALLTSVAGLVLLLYLLKPSSRRLLVSSTLIWRRVLRARKHASDRLRWWMSLALALAIALSIALAATRPQLAAMAQVAQTVVLVLDNSTTLGTLASDGKTRFQHAQEQARGIVEAGGAESRYLIADTQHQIASPRFEDRDPALATIRRLQVKTGGRPSFPDVVSAEAGLRQAIFVTDGVAGIEPPPAVRVVSVFQLADNAGITAFDVRPVPGDPRRHQAFVEIMNGSPGAKQIELQVAGAGAQPITRRFDVAAGAAATDILDVSNFAGGPLRASITTPYDALPIDDIAYSFVPTRRLIRVALVSAGNPSLERSLRLLPRVELIVMTPQRFSPRSGVDVWVFDRFAPREAPGAPALLFRPTRVEWLPRPGGDLGETAVTAWSQDHPVTDSLSLRDVLAERALAIRNGIRAQVIAMDANRRPLILASASGPRWVEVAFALEDSNLPLQPGFPVFLSNTLNWMTGEPLALQSGLGLVEVPVVAARVLDLKGVQVATRGVPGATVVEVSQPGFYTAIGVDRRVRVAVNVLDPMLTAVNQSRLASQPAAPLRPPAAIRIAASPWVACLLFAALLLMLEWWTYNRRMTV